MISKVCYQTLYFDFGRLPFVQYIVYIYFVLNTLVECTTWGHLCTTELTWNAALNQHSAVYFSLYQSQRRRDIGVPSLHLPSEMYLCWGCADTRSDVSVCCLSVCADCEMYSVQEPCSPSTEKHDAGLRKQSAPVVQHVIQSNNSIVIQPHADDRKTEKGWAQFEEDTQGLHSICYHSVFLVNNVYCLQYHEYCTCEVALSLYQVGHTVINYMATVLMLLLAFLD